MTRSRKRDLLSIFTQLPLFDDLFLRMQATNIALVDAHLDDLESDLCATLHSTERTPVPEAMFVSAISQMWVFAVYELLRTWRQRVRELIDFGERVRPLRGKARTTAIAAAQEVIRGTRSEDAAVHARRAAVAWASSGRNRARLRKALERVMPLYRRLEALRISLAKHEVAKTGRGKNATPVVAFAPGYGRIDPLDGSIKWLFDYADGTSDMLSRRGIADELRELHRGGTTFGPAA